MHGDSMVVWGGFSLSAINDQARPFVNKVFSAEIAFRCIVLSARLASGVPRTFVEVEVSRPSLQSDTKLCEQSCRPPTLQEE